MKILRWLQYALRRNTLTGYLLATIAVASGEELNFDEIKASLNGPVRVKLANGNAQIGQITTWDGDQLQLEITLDAGSAVMFIRAEEVDTIQFQGGAYIELLWEMSENPNQVEDTLTLFRLFYKQRGAFLQFLESGDLQLFIRYAKFALQNNKPLRAVAIIEVLRPHIKNEAILESLEDATLLGFFLGGLDQEAEEMSRKWIQNAQPAGPSALGWRILAEIHFGKERYEETLWTALYPIAFANQMAAEHLDICYAFAIAAAEETRQPEISERLIEEMRAKGLNWPTDIALLESFRPVPPEELPQTPTKVYLLEEENEVIQFPSPVDPVESLPTRIQQIYRTDDPFNQATTHENN